MAPPTQKQQVWGDQHVILQVPQHDQVLQPSLSLIVQHVSLGNVGHQLRVLAYGREQVDMEEQGA